MKILSVVLALASALGASAAPAARLVDTAGWHELACPDFTLYAQLNEHDTAAWAGTLAQFLTAIKGHLQSDSRILRPFTIILFSNRADFWDSAPVLKTGDPMENIGSFSRGGDWGAFAATSVEGSNQDTQRVIFQAGVERVLDGDRRRRPRAFNTGLSEVYSSYLIDNNQEVIGRVIPGWKRLLYRGATHPLNSDERFLKIEDLLAVQDMDSVAERHGVPMFYAESWGLAHFLLFSKEMAKQHAMDRLLDAFARNPSPHEAMQAVFGAGAGSIDTLFYNYIKGGDFFEFRLPIDPAPALAPPLAADPADVAATLAKLEASVKNSDLALSYAEQAVRLGPTKAPPHEALALVNRMAGRQLAVAAECRQAIQYNTRDAWTWFLASAEVGRTDEGKAGLPLKLDPDQAREAVNDSERAIICCKGLTAAYDRLADLIPAANHVTLEDGKFLVFGRTLFPDDGWIEIGHAQWARRTHQEDLALKIVDDVIARSADLKPEEVAMARALRQEWAIP